MITMDVFYHYCSTTAFHSIVDSKHIHLSSLTLSNDTSEGKMVATTLTELAQRDGLDHSTREQLQKYLKFFDEKFDGLGFCMSEDGDVLSQWRGYASDGAGVAIGFSRTYLERLGAQIGTSGVQNFGVQKVKYTTAEHQEQVEPTYKELKKLIDMGAFKMPWRRTLLDTRTDEEFGHDQKEHQKLQQTLFIRLLELFPKLYLLKSSAFKEEKEWRLISHLILEIENAAKAQFRPLLDRLIPYKAVELADTVGQAIVEVVLGPKHLTPMSVVKEFLKRQGFGDVTVRRSEASYR